jgi:Flp pilus assembly pilin Flp
MAFSLQQLQTWLSSLLSARDGDRGASLVEYALLLALIAMIVIVAVTAIGETTNESLSGAASSMATP